MNEKYDLTKDDKFFLSILDSLLLSHEREYVLIHDEKVVNIYSSREDAMAYAIANYKYGEYLISQIIKQEDAPKFVSFRYSYI